ncbi:hypothetical protein IMZ08_06155 [Bacillus luteolus]|uniref:Lipoprotein n=1 Tax=Litchfieldia luteola TaxID=682179 RepID=A0ABR9QGN7_9BACI|nr:hypothetical protein [Cytobacillus luteolus]MBE4907633.1 hypothetical protein [Cytobacillus luteolus]MBP1941084.1 hypothetical protein [Cytobacillus luteolus]
MRKPIVLVLTSILLTSCSNSEESATSKQDNNIEEERDIQEIQDEETNNTVPNPDAEQIMSNYKESFMKLVEKRDKKGRLLNFSSIDEVMVHFQSTMSKELAEWYAETYFREENGKIILKAMDSPTWFVQDKEYSLVNVDERNYRLIQERNNELLGYVNMIFNLSFTEKKWIVDSIDIEHLDHENEKNQEAITKEIAVSIVRQQLDISTDSSTIVEFDHHDQEGNYVIHVYDIVTTEKESHTATIGWYIVNKQNGQVENMM